MSHELHVDAEGRIAEITIDAPQRNSLDRAAIAALQRLLDEVSERPSLRVVIISGAAGNFCGGRIRTSGLVTEDEIRTDLAPILALNQLFEDYRLPIIAAVEGVAFGFGFGLSMLADVTVTARDAKFALTELAHGVAPLIVLSYLFRLLPYKVAFDLALSGREIGAEEALALGLASEVCGPGESLRHAREVARHIVDADQEAVLLLRSFARHNAALVDREAAAIGADRIAALLAARVQRGES